MRLPTSTKVAAVVVAALLAGGVAGCSQPTTTSPSTSSGNSSAPSDASTALNAQDPSSMTPVKMADSLIPTTPTTLNVWVSADILADPYEQQFIQEFQALYPTITINDVVAPDASTDAFLSAMASGTNPGVYAGGYPTVQQYIYRNAAMPLDDFISQTPDFQNFDQSQVAMFQAGGKTYGVPEDAYVMGFMYNKAEFAAAGISSPPTTWDELESDCAKLTIPSQQQYCFYIMANQWGSWPFETWVREAGGDLTQKNADGTVTLTFTDPAAITAAQFWRKLRSEGYTQSDMTMGVDAMFPEFASGHAAIIYYSLNGSSVQGIVGDGGVASNIGYFTGLKGPSGQMSVLNGGDGFLIPSNDSPDVAKAAWCYIMYKMSLKRVAMNLVRDADAGTLGQTILPRTDLQISDFGTADEALGQVLAEAMPLSTPEYWAKGAVGSFMDDGVQAMFSNPSADIQSTFQAAQDKAQSTADDFNTAVLTKQ